MKSCREKFVCQDVHMSLRGGFASDVMSGSDTARDTWQDGEGRECRFVSTGKERKQNAVNFKRDFLLHAAEEIFEVQGERSGACAGRRSTRDGWWTYATRKEHSQQQARKEHSQQQARKEHSQQQAEGTRRSASPASSRTDANLLKKLQYSRQSRWSIRSLAKL